MEQEDFGSLLAQYLERSDIPKARLARNAGIGRQTLYRWMDGDLPQDEEAVRRLAMQLRLAPQERDHLLRAAGFLPVSTAVPTVVPEEATATQLAVQAAKKPAPLPRQTITIGGIVAAAVVVCAGLLALVYFTLIRPLADPMRAALSASGSADAYEEAITKERNPTIHIRFPSWYVPKLTGQSQDTKRQIERLLDRGDYYHLFSDRCFQVLGEEAEELYLGGLVDDPLIVTDGEVELPLAITVLSEEEVVLTDLRIEVEHYEPPTLTEGAWLRRVSLTHAGPPQAGGRPEIVAQTLLPIEVSLAPGLLSENLLRDQFYEISADRSVGLAVMTRMDEPGEYRVSVHVSGLLPGQEVPFERSAGPAVYKWLYVPFDELGSRAGIVAEEIPCRPQSPYELPTAGE